MKVIILSGVSGSGKSTWARGLRGDAMGVIFSADQFFCRDGGYHFDPSKLQQAHEACLKGFVEEVRGVEPSPLDVPIIVDNTNTTVEEIAPYYCVAKAYGWQVELITFIIDYKIASERNRHGVSFNSIADQGLRLSKRKLPSFWEMKRTIMYWRRYGHGGWEQSNG